MFNKSWQYLYNTTQLFLRIADRLTAKIKMQEIEFYIPEFNTLYDNVEKVTDERKNKNS